MSFKKPNRMNNSVEIESDGINVFATMSVKAKPVGIVILLIFVLFLIVAFILIVSTFEKNEIGKLILPTLILFILFIFLPIRYLLWNLFGKENLIVNTKTISYWYDYGFIRTNLKTIKYDRLATDFLSNRKENEKEFGNLIFYNYNKDTNLPELIHQTSVYIELEKLKEIDLLIQNIFENEFNDKQGFMGYSLN